MCGAWPERSRAFAPPRSPPRRSRARAGRWSGTESPLSLPAGVLWAEGATARPPRSRGRCAKPQLPRAPEHAQRRRVHRRGRDARKSAAFCKIEIAPGRDWHIVPLAGLCAPRVPRLCAPLAAASPAPGRAGPPRARVCLLPPSCSRETPQRVSLPTRTRRFTYPKLGTTRPCGCPAGVDCAGARPTGVGGSPASA